MAKPCLKPIMIFLNGTFFAQGVLHKFLWDFYIAGPVAAEHS